MQTVKQQTSNDKMWTDEAGGQVPYSRTTKAERLMEKESVKLLKGATKLNSDLAAFKAQIREICTNVYETFMAEKNNAGKEAKGNFTWYNFDRSIKVEVNINEQIVFDDLTIKACKDKLDEFLKGNLESKDDFIKELVMSAFETSRGRLDSKKVMSLLKYREKIKHPLFNEALNLLESSIRKSDSRTYFKVSYKDANGKYITIDLNFSSI